MQGRYLQLWRCTPAAIFQPAEQERRAVMGAPGTLRAQRQGQALDPILSPSELRRYQSRKLSRQVGLAGTAT